MKNRRSIRLKEYDYSQSGAYFITICAYDRKCLFCEIVDGQITLNDVGRMIDEQWQDLKTRFPDIELDECVIMPNHFHGIVMLNPENYQTVGAGSSCPNETTKSSGDGGREDRAPTLGDIVGYFKYRTTKQINATPETGIKKLWQRNYYEHVIRNEAKLNEIRQYIVDNPAKWDTDEENPNAQPAQM
jgi:REP element-mobilizing transposase RayT